MPRYTYIQLRYSTYVAILGSLSRKCFVNYVLTLSPGLRIYVTLNFSDQEYAYIRASDLSNNLLRL